MFRAIMEASEFDNETGHAVVDYSLTERQLLVDFNVVRPVDVLWVAECRDLLARDPALLAGLNRFKPWHPTTLYQLNIGYDPHNDRFTIPVYDRSGTLVNVRMYRPGGEPKMLWLVPGLTGNFLFPHAGWREQSVILVEGETDALTLRSFGFLAVSGTLGSGQPVPEGEWWRDRIVYVWMDSDASGHEAELESISRMQPLASQLYSVRLPLWDGRPANADASDWIRHLLSIGYEPEQVQRAISDLLGAAEPIERSTLDAEPVNVTFHNLLDAERVGTRIRFTARVTAKSPSRFILPIRYTITCPAQGHNYCRRCPMSHQWHGNASFRHDPRDVRTLKLIQVSEKQQGDALCEANGIVVECPDPRVNVTQSIVVEPVIISASINEVVDDSSFDRSRHESYVVVSNEVRALEENRDYEFSGYTYPHPRNQQGVVLIDNYTPKASVFESFRTTDDIIDELYAFVPGPSQSVLEKLYDVSDDLANSITLIRGRQDLHMIYRTVWHSCLAFTFMQSVFERGWIELLVMGDTRCGKSAAFRRMSEHYSLGLLVDCKSQTLPGILGTVVQSSSGEYYVVAGVMPQQDGRIICFDEFHVPKWSGTGMIEALSSTRAEGAVRITKAASAEFKARVRSIWLANPGGGRLIREMPDRGIEMIHRIINQPEDIARFDAAMIVSQDDVSNEDINTQTYPTDPRYSRSASRSLLAWTYSRRPDQVVFTSDAEAEVFRVTREMLERYTSSIPLVEPADQRNRVAKFAVSIAAQCFSSDYDYENIVVKPEHVAAAQGLFTMMYDSSNVDYHGFARREMLNRTIIDEAEVQSLFDQTMAPHGRRFAEEILRLDEFSERAIFSIVPVSNMYASQVLQRLYANRCVHLTSRGKRDTYEKTPAFNAWLKRYVGDR